MRLIVVALLLLTASATLWNDAFTTDDTCDRTVACCPSPNQPVVPNVRNGNTLEIDIIASGRCGPQRDVQIEATGDLSGDSFIANSRAAFGGLVPYKFTKTDAGINVLNIKNPSYSFNLLNGNKIVPPTPEKSIPRWAGNHVVEAICDPYKCCCLSNGNEVNVTEQNGFLTLKSDDFFGTCPGSDRIVRQATRKFTAITASQMDSINSLEPKNFVLKRNKVGLAIYDLNKPECVLSTIFKDPSPEYAGLWTGSFSASAGGYKCKQDNCCCLVGNLELRETGGKIQAKGIWSGMCFGAAKGSYESTISLDVTSRYQRDANFGYLRTAYGLRLLDRQGICSEELVQN